MKLFLKIFIVLVIIVAILLCIYCTYNRYTIDYPYDYGYTFTYNDFKDLRSDKFKEIYTLPKEVTNKMTTDAFVESLLNNGYFFGLVSFNGLSSDLSYSKTILSDERLNIEDLLKRNDFEVVIIGKEQELLSKYGCNSVSDFYNLIDVEENFDDFCRISNIEWLIGMLE